MRKFGDFEGIVRGMLKEEREGRLVRRWKKITMRKKRRGILMEMVI